MLPLAIPPTDADHFWKRRMTDSKTPEDDAAPDNGGGNDSGGDPEAAHPALVVNIQYVKDLSFESPTAPAGLLNAEAAPEVSIEVNVNAERLADNVYEVVLNINAKAMIEDATTFIAELAYGGVFTINNIPDDSLGAALLIECPRLLFPFARSIVADATRDGGFPPLMIHPIDFAALYRERLAAAG